MIFLTIGGLPLWVADSWDLIKTTKWSAIRLKSWSEILNRDKSENIKIINNTFNINDKVEDISTADFTLIDFNKTYHFLKGMPVNIYNENDKIFSGFIETSEEKQIGSIDSYYLQHTISCIDNHYLVNKRKVIKVFNDELVTDCVTWILDNILSDEFILYGNIVDSDITITKVCNFANCNDVLDELAETVGYTWFIDLDRKLYFVPRSTYLSPYNIEIVNNQCAYIRNDTFTVTDGNSEFRNIQYVKGGNEKTDLQTEYKTGDGNNQTFTVGYPIAETPVIYLNDNVQTVGIRGVNTTENWFWSKNDNSISQLSTGTKLVSTDILRIEYYGLYPVSVQSSNYESITERALIEGSSGKVECLLEDSSFETKNDALAKANSLLSLLSVMGKICSWDTFDTGLEAGQLIHITYPLHELDHDCLITQVDKKDEDGSILYSITAVSGPVDDFWVKFWTKSAQKKQTSDTTTSINDVLQILIYFTKTWDEATKPNIFDECYADGTIYPGNANFPCFDETDRIKYLQLDSSSGYRRYRTAQTRTATQIVTTVIIPSADANETWTEISLWGGSLATITKDSGIKVTSHSHHYTKNNLESLMIVCTDNKWS